MKLSVIKSGKQHKRSDSNKRNHYECRETKRIRENVKIDGKLNVKCNTKLEKNLTVMKNETVYGNSTLMGNVSVGKDLTVNGETTLNGQVVINNGLCIDGTIPPVQVPISGSGTFNAFPVNYPTDFTQTQYQKLYIPTFGPVSLTVSWNPNDEIYVYIYKPGVDAGVINSAFSPMTDNLAVVKGIVAFDESGVSPVTLNFDPLFIGEYTIRLYHAVRHLIPSNTVTLTGTINPGDDLYLDIPMTDASATAMNATVSWDNAATDIDIYLYGTPPDYVSLGSSETNNNPEIIDGADITGVSPKVGNYSLELFHFSGPSANYTATVQYGVYSTSTTYTLSGYWTKTAEPTKTNYLDTSNMVTVSRPDISGLWLDDARDGGANILITKDTSGYTATFLSGDPFHVRTSQALNDIPNVNNQAGSSGISVNAARLRPIDNGYSLNPDVDNIEAWDNISNAQQTILLDQSDPNVFWFRFESPRLGMNSDFDCQTTRYKRAPKEFQTVNSQPFTDLSNPVYLFNAICDTATYAYATHLNKAAQCTDFPGWNKMLQFKNKLLTTGVNYTTQVTDVWPTIKTLSAPVALPNDPFRTYASVNVRNVDIEIVNFGLTYAIIYNNTGLYPTGATLRISGVSEAAVLGIPNEVVNSYWLVFSSNSGSLILRNLSPGYILNNPDTLFTASNITIDCLSYRVTHATPHGFTSLIQSGASPMIQFSGSTSVGGLPASLFNRSTTITYVSSSTRYFITFPPGTERSNDIKGLQSVAGGGAGVTVSVWTKPARPSALGYYNANPPFYRVTPCTVLFTDVFNGHHLGAMVNISGFTGAYSSLNGTWPSHESQYSMLNSKDKKESYNPSHYNFSSAHYPVPIEFDSSDFPVYDPNIHGIATVSITYGPVTPTIEYGQFVAACKEFAQFLGTQTHGGLYGLNTIRYALSQSTWNGLQETTNMGLYNPSSSGNRDNDRCTNQGHYIEVGGGDFGLNSPFFVNDLPTAAKNNPGPGQINQSLRYDNSDAKWAYSISRENYLDKATLKNVVMTMDPLGGTLEDNVPGSDPNRMHLSEYLTGFGYDYNSIKPNFKVVPFGSQTGGDGSVVMSVINNLPVSVRYGATLSSTGTAGLPLNGNFVLADPIEATSSLNNAASCVGKIVVCRRGSNSFEQKVLNAFNAGAVGVVVWNSTGTFERISMNVVSATMIPSMMISKTDGQALTGYLGGNELNPANYTMSTTGANTYTGTMKQPGPGESLPLLGANPGIFYFGQVKPELLPVGKKVGYIRMGNTLFYDPLGLMQKPEFTNNPGVDDIWDVARQMWATVLTTDINGTMLKDMDGIILEVRANGGGGAWLQTSLACALGNDRYNYKSNGNYPYRDNGNSTDFTNDEMDALSPPLLLDVQKLKETRSETEYVHCSKFQADFPSAVVTNKNIVILWSTQAYSGGDLFVHPFRKDFGNHGDLGNGVKTYIVGNGDGRLFGGSGSPIWAPASDSSITKLYPSTSHDNQIISPIGLQGESSYFYTRTIDSNGHIQNQLPCTAMDAGPLSGWVEDDTGFYPSVGLAPYPVSRQGPAYANFNAVLGVPDQNVQKSWHDPWLEEAIIRAYTP